MANGDFDLSLFPVFDQSLFELNLASEMLREAWKQVYNRPIRNAFRKLNFALYQKISVEGLGKIEETRNGSEIGGTIYWSIFHSIFFELDRHARYLERFGTHLNTGISGLLGKANGHPYPFSEYKRDLELIDVFREQLIESQQRLNLAIRAFLTEFDPEDIPGFPTGKV